MPTPRPECKWTVYLDARQRAELERRGAHPDRRHGPAGRSSVVRRRLDLLAAVLEVSDPRETHGLPEAYLRLAVRLLPDACRLPVGLVKMLDAHLATLRALPVAAAEEGVPPEAFLAAIAALPVAQRVFLVDLAEQENVRGEAGEPGPESPAAPSRPPT